MIKKQKGFTLTEILLVLVIAAAIVISAFIIYPKVQVSQRVNQDSTNIAALIGGIKGMYGSNANYTGLTTQSVIDAKVAPESMVKNSKLFLSNNKEITISQNTSSTSGYLYNYFVIMMNNFPPEDCARIAPIIFKNGFILRINSDQVSRDAAQPTEFNVGEAIKSCNQKSNSIDLFVY